MAQAKKGYPEFDPSSISNTEIQVIKTDLTWIKWLFGLFFSLIIVLLSTVLTVLFKLVG